MKIFLTGTSGFVASNLIVFFRDNYCIYKFNRNSQIQIRENIVIHLAGKAHDLKKVSDPDEYYLANTEFSKKIFDGFLTSDATVFIILSSVKAVADNVDNILTEESIPNPITHYGKSKLLAEQYILSKKIPKNKRVYILRPTMIHGPGNKGNLNLLYKLVSTGFPWPLGKFNNKRSFCTIDNLLFVINELIEREDIPSGIYNVADDNPLSTNEVISLIAESQNREPKIWKISKLAIQLLAYLGNFLQLPISLERLQKLTESYVVSNSKIKFAIGKDFPVTAKDGLLKTFKSFNSKNI